MNAAELISAAEAWCAARPDIEAAALLGSHARGQARASSDIDLLLLSRNWPDFLLDTAWIEHFGAVELTQLEDYGAVKSLRVWYLNGPEVEFSFSGPEWASLPLDPGTLDVVRGGLRILYDPAGLLAQLLPPL